MTFTVLDASSWEAGGLEQIGVTQHLWLRHPEDGALHLWKPATGRRLERREHWAEKLASEIAGVLGMPCAHVELAERNAVPGCLSRNLMTEGEEIFAGALFLGGIDPTFDPATRGHPVYTIANVERVLNGVEGPAGFVGLPPTAVAFDVFAGYMAFDALVLNRDRHAANWSVLRRRDGSRPDRLCPLYDNASALALSMSDSKMANRAASRGIAAYISRESIARPFARTDGKDRSVFEVAGEALARCDDEMREHWRARVLALRDDEVWRLVSEIPGMSEVVRTFLVELVACTRRRVLDGASS